MHLLRIAGLQGTGQGDRRICGLQEPPQLSAAQWFRLSRFRERPRTIQTSKEALQFPIDTPTQGTCEEAHCGNTKRQAPRPLNICRYYDSFTCRPSPSMATIPPSFRWAPTTMIWRHRGRHRRPPGRRHQPRLQNLPQRHARFKHRHRHQRSSDDTIDYVATDSTGLTATSTRTVIIEAA